MMLKQMPAAHARSNAQRISESNAMRRSSALCTDVRTDVLTEKHLTFWDEGSTPYRAGAKNEFDFDWDVPVGIAALADALLELANAAGREP